MVEEKRESHNHRGREGRRRRGGAATVTASMYIVLVSLLLLLTDMQHQHVVASAAPDADSSQLLQPSAESEDFKLYLLSSLKPAIKKKDDVEVKR